ncbi:hypothetical protein M1105_17080 [Limibaculum sp. FT325]|uniref:hypothetical protein n=1 Tax=Thermohalobaculum sediminis TaxID=2939436 RepID=UPI0020BE4A64|nr:hypothetical protein [Limibaculum sediminis]MCL5778694.1 hypothetical protein [Limibaculum sediminis]
MRAATSLAGSQRDSVIVEAVLGGNVPQFLRRLVPVTLEGTTRDDRDVRITICVTPDYLAVGDDTDFVRTPVGLPAALRIAGALDFMLPTPRMVDAIYAAASVRLPPRPMEPTAAMTSTRYFVEHNAEVDRQRTASGQPLGALTAGHKKDVVLSRRLAKAHGKVAIYGWHRPNGRPIQPLSTVHGAQYADYSHGIRLVAATAQVNGVPRPLAEVLADPDLAGIVSGEGPIERPDRLVAALGD